MNTRIVLHTEVKPSGPPPKGAARYFIVRYWVDAFGRKPTWDEVKVAPDNTPEPVIVKDYAAEAAARQRRQSKLQEKKQLASTPGSITRSAGIRARQIRELKSHAKTDIAARAALEVLKQI